MAAYAALASLLNDLELIPNHAIHSFSFDIKQISSLSQTVEILIDFIETCDSHGEAAQDLESRITHAAHAAHGVIESHIVDQIHAGSTRCGKLRSYFLLDLQSAIDSMEFVKRKAMQFKAKRRSKATYSSPSPPPAAAATSSEPLKNNVMVGFDEAVLRLVEILAGHSNQRLVVPVAGMGGLGKTSLTKAVYEHSYVREQFDVRLWATISQQYDAQNILTQLLCGENKSTTAGDELGEKLHKRLYGSKYLIVLDDMWSLEAWDKVRRYLPENGNGSRVVVTTRLSDMAVHLNSSPFKLNFLDEDKSWELFCKKAFGEEDCPIELEEIGKKIVRRCRGLPLSIVVMGGHLRRSSRGIGYWEKVAGYMNPISSVGEEEQCLEILSLSYQHLPACLKPCFLYLGIYGEDESIYASYLLRHWMKFVRAKRGLSMEEVGKDYLKDLIDRNLILLESSNWNGEVERCKVHDSVREVCLKVCKKEKFLCEVDDTTTQVRGCKVRRIVSPKGKNFNSHTIGVKQLSPPPLRLFNCSLLRVLLRHIKINSDGTCLPSAHFEQVNSRAAHLFNQYRRLQSLYSILTSLPTCWNLQTLHMMLVYQYSSSCEPMTLPYEIWEMPQLRILQARSIFLTNPVPAEGSYQQEECIILQNLHTLEGVVNLRLTEEVCKRMPNLKRLRVSYDHFCEEYGFQIGRFNKLILLEIEFDDDSKWCDVVPTLTLPTSLEELELRNCHLGWEDLTRMISSPLPHLASLYVTGVRGSEWNLDDEEVFCCLKRLQIWKCNDLIHWKANSSHFPVLECLELYNIPKLSEIPLDIGDIPTLRHINLSDCGASAAVSAVRMVVEQEIDYGNHDIQLHVYFSKYRCEEFERFEEMMEEECIITTNNIHLYFNWKKIEKTLL